MLRKFVFALVAVVWLTDVPMSLVPVNVTATPLMVGSPRSMMPLLLAST